MNQNTNKHPCFQKEAKGECARVHLPVAPNCNVQCKFCNRAYDCINESRPGVASGVLSPAQALDYLGKVLEKEPRTTVAGIAGPGDPMANPEATLQTLALIKQHYPHLFLCLATNGLALPEYVDELLELGITHVTVTINAVDPDIQKQIYSWIREDNVIYTGREAGEMMLSRQIQSVRRLKEAGIAVKVNTIVIPGVNFDHVQDIARVMGGLGVDLMNCVPLYPAENTEFAHIREPSNWRMAELRHSIWEYVPQMTHCQRCRADATGLLEHDQSMQWAGTLAEYSRKSGPVPEKKPHVAIASREGMLVNQHLGETGSLHIYTLRGEEVCYLEERRTPASGQGKKRWEELAEIVSDCRAVLVSAAGEKPCRILQDRGIRVAECSGPIHEVVQAVYTGTLHAFQSRKHGVYAGCSGEGEGDC